MGAARPLCFRMRKQPGRPATWAASRWSCCPLDSAGHVHAAERLPELDAAQSAAEVHRAESDLLEVVQIALDLHALASHARPHRWGLPMGAQRHAAAGDVLRSPPRHHRLPPSSPPRPALALSLDNHRRIRLPPGPVRARLTNRTPRAPTNPHHPGPEEAGAHPTRQLGHRPARNPSEAPKRAASTTDGPSRNIEVNAEADNLGPHFPRQATDHQEFHG